MFISIIRHFIINVYSNIFCKMLFYINEKGNIFLSFDIVSVRLCVYTAVF